LVTKLALDQTAELTFSQKKSAASGDKIGPEETEQHYTTLHMVIIKNFDLKKMVSLLHFVVSLLIITSEQDNMFIFSL